MTEFAENYLRFLHGEEFDTQKSELNRQWEEVYKKVIVKNGDYYANGMDESLGIAMQMIIDNEGTADSYILVQSAIRFLLEGTVTPEELIAKGMTESMVKKAVKSVENLRECTVEVPGILACSFFHGSPEDLIKEGTDESRAMREYKGARFLQTSWYFRHGIKSARKLAEEGWEEEYIRKVEELTKKESEFDLLLRTLKTADDLIEEGRDPAAVKQAFAEAGEKIEYLTIYDIFKVFLALGGTYEC